jgi:hypothetical protein
MIYSEINPKLGFYKVDNQIYYNKVAALMATKGTNHHPTWHFNDEVFDSVDWTVNPEMSINDLYYIRAKQLREKYDYLVLFYSGGADSTTVLKTFINNNLHLDEVISSHPISGLRQWENNNKDTDVSNTISEGEFALKPQLSWLSRVSSKTKITFTDYFDEMIKIYQSDDWFIEAKEYLHPSTIARYNKKNIPHIRKICESGKKIGFIFGIDKPRIAIIDNAYYSYFLDIIANISTWDLHEYSNASTEYFYWSPDVPLLTVKQCHLIIDWLKQETNYKFRSLLKWPPISNNELSKLKAVYERAVREPLYPDWDFSIFQAGKPTNCIWAEHDFWFFKNHRHTHIFDGWRAGIDHAKKLVPDQWWQYDNKNVLSGFKGFISKMRYLAPVK